MLRKLLVLLFCLPAMSYAQNSYNIIYNTLNTKCSNAGCHSATSADALKFDGSSTTVYNAIVGQMPTTAGAVSRGEKLVWKNQPYQSYLLKRAGSWLDADLALPGNETTTAHTAAGLSNKEAEYIRQWIMNGASQTGNTVDTALVNAYYNDTPRAVFYPKPTAPVPGTGTQLRFGPIFVPAASSKSEIEYLLKQEVNFPSNSEITLMAGDMNPQSHHFLLFKFDDSTAASQIADGLRVVSLSGGTTSFDGSKKLMGAWQTPAALPLPTGTALFWEQKTWLDFNFHVKNYSASGVLPFDFYLNCNYQQHLPTSTTIEMKSRLANNVGILLPPHTTTTTPFSDGDNGSNEMRYIWSISSHTHKFGTGFNIYEYSSSAPNHFGDTLYVGTWDYLNGFDRGYYDWEHPGIRFFSPQRPMNMQTNGLIVQTTWNNTSSNYITFGFQTSSEMQLFYYMYTNSLPNATGVAEITDKSFDFVVFPNPMSDLGTIAYKLVNTSNVKATIIDITGKEIAVLKEEKQVAGSYTVDMGKQTDLVKGIYFARVTVDGFNYTKKFVIQ